MNDAKRGRNVTSRGVGGVLAALMVVLAAGPVRGQNPDSIGGRPASADGAPSESERAAVSRVQALLAADMPVTASRTLARELSLGVIEGFDAVILAARAHSAQRAWGTVRRLLVGRDWTDPALESEALLLLAEAYLGLDSASRAAETFESYLETAPEPVPPTVRVDYARALLGRDEPAAAAGQLALLGRDYPDIARWADLSRLNALVAAQDTAAYALAETLARTPLIPADSAWRAAAALAFRTDDPDRGIAYARRADAAVWREFAEDYIAPHLLASGDTEGAVAAYRAAIERGRAAASTGPALLAHDRSWRALRDVGRSDARSGRRSRAADHLSRALEIAPAAERPEIAESLAEVHRAGGDHERVLRVVEPWLEDASVSAARRASLWLLAARSHAALGRRDASEAAYDRAASGAGNAAALAAYLIADTHHDAGRLEEARAAYEHSSGSFESSAFGSRSLERLALLDFHEGRFAEAREKLELYRRRYARGNWHQGAIYWTGKTHEAEGDEDAARALYLQTIAYNPLDYYAILAARRVSRDPWDSVNLREARPLAELTPYHAEVVARMNILRDLGWVWRARAEYREARERGPSQRAQVLAFAHALNANGWTQEGVAQGWRAKSGFPGWTRPLLEAIYPLPFPQALAHAAHDRGLAPHFVAGLARRESLFDPEIRSVANAIGLMQLLPETARDVAPRAGLPEYRRSQLTVPQVNLLLGTRYLADVLDRFGGAPIAGMISYNAGPHRYVRWREFPEFRDDEQLVERIPFRETREYVRAVTELSEIYRFLYPELGSTVP